MNSNSKIVDQTVAHALSGKGAHVATPSIFAGLDWKVAGNQPAGAPHSIFQLLKHMTYWQDWVVKWLDGKRPPVPKHASGSWPDTPDPVDAEEWKEAVKDFRVTLDELGRQSRKTDVFAMLGKKSRLEMLQTIASHTSYHAGQVVLLRQMLKKWPPPSGGLTW
ncbi:MAG TPA: DinB family protein [Terriglobales bacterium]|nr:DinB family protein [Terriglobales bacterium]